MAKLKQKTFFGAFGKSDLAKPAATGQAAAAECEAHAVSHGWNPEAAATFILDWLKTHGPTAGEVLVSEASKGNQPHDARCFGAVFLRLSRKGLIEHVGYCRRMKGHSGHGGVIWGLKKAEATS